MYFDIKNTDNLLTCHCLNLTEFRSKALQKNKNKKKFTPSLENYSMCETSDNTN